MVAEAGGLHPHRRGARTPESISVGSTYAETVRAYSKPLHEQRVGTPEWQLSDLWTNRVPVPQNDKAEYAIAFTDRTRPGPGSPQGC